jgi:hypothetical protein
MKKAVFNQRSVIVICGNTGSSHGSPWADCEVRFDWTHGSDCVEVIAAMQCRDGRHEQVGVFSANRDQLVSDLEWLLKRLKEKL